MDNHGSEVSETRTLITSQIPHNAGQNTYRRRAIITRGLYFFTPFFTAVYNQERLILQTTYVLKRGNSSKNAAVYNQERFQIKSGL